MKKSRVLVVAAHPDDEILGCGGTVARLIEEGCEGYTLVLGEGMTSRDEKRNRKARVKEINALKRQIEEAGRIIGIREVFSFDFPDNRFDTVPFLDIVKVIEKVKREVRPEIVFTHYEKDLNVDHQITSRAVLTATRPIPGETVREIYSFETLSSTEWSYPMSFSPDVFFDISGSLEVKLKAMKSYQGELRDFPHPRSLEGIALCARNRGMQVGVPHAEAFKMIRMIRPWI